MERYNPLSPAATFEEQQQQALHQCDHLIRDFAQRADRNKTRFQRLQTASITLAIATTVLSALSASQLLGQLDWIVLTLSGLATLSTTFLSQTNTQKLWVQSRSTSQQFQREMFLYLQGGGDYAMAQGDADRLRLFSSRLMTVWAQAQETWAQHTSSAQ
jgi:hypothetical protein